VVGKSSALQHKEYDIELNAESAVGALDVGSLWRGMRVLLNHGILVDIWHVQQ
jgi:hypothetical protein